MRADRGRPMRTGHRAGARAPAPETRPAQPDRRRPNLRVLGPEDRPRRRDVRRQRRAESGARRDRSVGILLTATFLLVGAGLVMVLSASSVSSLEANGSSFTFFRRQLIYAVIGSAAMLVTSRMRLVAWQRLAFPLTVVTGILMALVLIPGVGTVSGGAARWIAIGPVTIQPSELAKLAMAALAATILTRKWRLLADPVQVALPLGPIMLFLGLLVALQRDLGTLMVLSAMVFLMLFIAGIRMKFLAVTGAIAGGIGVAMIVLEPYRLSRLFGFLDPFADPSFKGFHLIQSLVAFGSGGWFGVGLGASRQKWSYIPNSHTDFIFAIIGEELGLLGCIALLAVFGVLLYAAIRIAIRARDRFSRFLAAGIAGWLGFQTLLNLGAVTGMLPIAGVPLPFVSFGGSALIVSLAAVGILVRVGRESSAREVARAPRVARRSA